MSVLKAKNPLIREKRLNAINAYYGDLNALLQEFKDQGEKQRIRTFSQTTADDIINILSVVSKINNAAVIVHGARGCASSALYFKDSGSSYSAVTNLSERNTIMGGEANLREAIITLNRRYRPEIIFILATPIVAINNDDILSVLEEVKDEISMPIVPIFADGFKSKTGISGYDVFYHALFKYVRPANVSSKEDFVNVLAMTDNQEDQREVLRLLNGLGIKVNLLSGLNLRRAVGEAPKARLSVAANVDYANYLGEILETEYEVPFLKAGTPVGVAGTNNWLRALGKALNIEQAAEALIQEETQELNDFLVQYDLNNIRVYINLPTAAAIQVLKLTATVGAEIAGITVGHVDTLHQELLIELLEAHPTLKLHVADGQPFEVANILQKLQPDLYIGSPANSVWVAKLGIPVVSPHSGGMIGYRGAVRFLHSIKKALHNKAFINKIAENSSLPYQPSWYKKSANWFIKQEVK